MLLLQPFSLSFKPEFFPLSLLLGLSLSLFHLASKLFFLLFLSLVHQLNLPLSLLLPPLLLELPLPFTLHLLLLFLQQSQSVLLFLNLALSVPLRSHQLSLLHLESSVLIDHLCQDLEVWQAVIVNAL